MGAWDWREVNTVADDVLVTAGIAVLVVRQFLWRSAEPARMLRTPLLVTAAGLAYLPFELAGGIRWRPGDVLLVAELGLAVLTGTGMGHVTRFRGSGDHLQHRLTTVGLAWWVVFVGVRVGDLALAGHLGAHLAGATGLVLLSFGANRLAACRVVRRRARRLLHEGERADRGPAAAPIGSPRPTLG